MEKDQADFYKNLKLLLKRKWLWIIPTIVFTIGAAIYAINQPDIYETRCVLAVENSELLNTVLGERRGVSGVAPDTRKILQTVSNRMLGWEPVLKVIKSLGLDKDIPEDDISALEELYGSITGSIELSVGGKKSRKDNNNIISVYCQGINPEGNVLVLNNLVSNFMEQSMYTSQVEVEKTIEFMDEEVERLKRVFYESEKKLRQFEQERFDVLPGNRENMLSELYSSEKELASIDGEIMTLRERLDFLQERKKGEGETVVGETVQIPTPIINDLKNQIVNLEIEITKLRARYFDEHPGIVLRQKELTDLKEMLEKESEKVVTEEGKFAYNPRYESLVEKEFELQLQLKSLQKRRKEFESLIATFTESVKGKSELGQEYYELQREYETNKGLYEQRLLQRSKADLVKEISLDEKANPFTIIEPARISYKPIKVNKIQTIAFGFVIGVGLGFGLIFGLEKIDQRFKTVDEIKEYLQIPALGMIPIILTKTDIRKKIRKKIITASLLSVFVISAITVSFVVQPVKGIINNVVNDQVTKAIKLVK
ncbi:MAG: GumC family protein [Planctomycetota bacterium]|jgi:polysaccharide chain length determinant protein (PEP-CTERM system associated)